MKIIGLTGGIGSGKTTVAKIFEELDVPVYFADDEAKKLYLTNSEMKKEIIIAFGHQTYIDGELNREYLGNQVFGDKTKLELLNAIVHPQLEEHYKNWLTQHRDKPYVMKEAAILIEMGGHKDCDFVILVSASEDIRIKRVIERDRTTSQQVRNRIDMQMSERDKRKFADFIIDNSGEEMIIPQIMDIHAKVLNSRV